VTLMKHADTRAIFILLSTLLVVGCNNNPFTTSSIFTDQTSTPYPSKEILINNGSFNKPYIVLGPVEYTLKRYISIFVDQVALRNQAIAFLKQEALSSYGGKVDAISDLVVEESTEEGYDGQLSVTYVKGIAIAFKPEGNAANHKSKHKTKSSKKNTSRKAKPSKNASRKVESKERKITQSEILK
jgi:hypothetical protein